MKINITIEQFQKLVILGKSYREIADELQVSVTGIRHFMKRNNLNDFYNEERKKIKLKIQKQFEKERPCLKCHQIFSIESFFKIKKSGRKSVSIYPYCKACLNNINRARTRKIKNAAVNYKGGKCENCGYDKYIGALEFHHLDPTKKDFNISHYASKNFEKIKNELDKCKLLCSNCHREVHGNLE